MKFKTLGVLLSLVCAITLGSAKGNAVANELKVTKNEISAVVEHAVKEQCDTVAFEFGKHGKEGNGNDELLEIFEERIDFDILNDIEKNPSNYDTIKLTQGIFSMLGDKEKEELDNYAGLGARILSKEERAFLKVIREQTITETDDYQAYIEEEFSEEIERFRNMNRAYYYSNPPQVYQGNTNSLMNAMVCLLPMWVVVAMMAEIAIAAGAINIPIVGQAIAAAAILALAATILCILYIAAQIFAELIKIISDFFGSKFKKAISNWFRQIKAKVWNDNRRNAFVSVKNKYGSQTKWKSADDMDKALNKALHYGAGTIATAALLDKFLNDERFRVYIGRLDDNPNYVYYASLDEHGVAFRMSDDDWDEYVRKGYNMWILNEYFLAIFCGLGNEFELCSNPSQWYSIVNDRVIGNSSYGKELQYIHKRGYVWPSVFTQPYISANVAM